MTSFDYRGRIPGSKSILNRALILQSFSPLIEVLDDSQADDVVKMKSALRQLANGEVADCGAAGTTFRFIAFRASRMKGTHDLTGSPRLFERPQSEIARVLSQLGCEVSFGSQRVTIRSEGWQWPSEGVTIDQGISSQFASALILSAWNLSEDLKIRLAGESVSAGYLQMTLDLVAKAGMRWVRTDANTIVIPAGAELTAKRFAVESDLSSAFAVAALAAVKGRAVLLDWPETSLQPDSVFVSVLERMGVRIERRSGELFIEKPREPLGPIEFDLRHSPDLFPILSVLCGLARGRSRLVGAPHLIHKESDRVAKSAELLQKMNRRTTAIPGGLEIEGRPEVTSHTFEYDPDHDHRLAMAGAVARAAGFRIQILRPEVVNKSFPEFWEIARGAGA